ncbi:NAD(P)H-dependent oxidoreductase [Candidatus Peregrinibacteria bacterium]|nr:MAG: NAD(P)H-dependent oxidoreductase [Candidatus Peregrinibacteria bacterium]
MEKNLIEALQWRYAVKQFDPTKKISPEDLQFILSAGNLMPTSYGLQPFRLVVVENPELKEKLVEHSYGQRHVADNTYLIVMAVRTDINEEMVAEFTHRIEQIRQLPAGAVDGYKKVMVGDLTNRTPEARRIWAQKQAYLALGGMIAAASEKGIDNHCLEGFNPDRYDEILGLSERNLHATVIMAIGQRSEADESQHQKKVRVSEDQMIIRL